MDEKKQIKSTDWLAARYSEEEIAKMKAEAIKEAETEVREKQIDEMTKIACVGFREGDCENCKSVGICSSYTISEKLYNAGYRKQTVGEWMSAYDYALKLGITDEKRLSDAKKDKWWKFCNKCEQAVKGFHNYCPNCGKRMKGGAE